MLKVIQDAALAARKARNTDRAVLLSTLLAEAIKVGKDKGNRAPSDAEVVKTIKNFLNGIELSVTELNRALLKDANELKTKAREKLLTEKSILTSLLPPESEMASGEQLQVVIDKVLSETSDKSAKVMGVIMKELKLAFGDNFDGKRANMLVTATLAK